MENRKKLWFEEWYCPIEAFFSGLPFFAGGIGLGFASNILPENIRPIAIIPGVALVGFGIIKMYQSYEDCVNPPEPPEKGDIDIEFLYPTEGQEIEAPLFSLRPRFKVYNLKKKKKLHIYTKHTMTYRETWETWEQKGEFIIRYEEVEIEDEPDWWPGGLFQFRPGRWIYTVHVYKDEERKECIGTWQVSFKIAGAWEKPEKGDIDIEFTYPVENQKISKPWLCFQPKYKVYNKNKKKTRAYLLHILTCWDTWESWRQEDSVEFPNKEECVEKQDPCAWWPGGIFQTRTGKWTYEIQAYADESKEEWLGSWQVTFYIV